MAALVEVIGHTDRARPLADYCTGPLLPIERKSLEPLAAVTAPGRVAAQHQSLLPFIGNAPWSDELVLPPKAWSGRGRPPSRARRDSGRRPLQIKALALGLADTAWETLTWREGSADWLTSRYARLRVRAAHHDQRLKQLREEEWLLIEWPESEKEPSKYCLATHPETAPFAELVDLATLRRRLAAALARSVGRCPCCNAPPKPNIHHLLRRCKIKAWQILKDQPIRVRTASRGSFQQPQP